MATEKLKINDSISNVDVVNGRIKVNITGLPTQSTPNIVTGTQTVEADTSCVIVDFLEIQGTFNEYGNCEIL